MFQINSYLQFRNTPNGKPKLIKLFEKWEIETEEFVVKDKKTTKIDSFARTGEKSIIIQEEKVIKKTKKQYLHYFDEYFEWHKVCLEDCRPLLTTAIGQECDIIVDQVCIKGCFNLYMIHFETNNYGFTNQVKEETEHCADYCSKFTDEKDIENQKKVESMFGKFKHGKNVVGSFFDDSAKYSKLLWDCSEEEGWDKIFKLLEIEK